MKVLLWLLWSPIVCWARINWAELEYLSDELTEKDCFRLLCGLRDPAWIVNQTQVDEVFILSNVSYVKTIPLKILAMLTVPSSLIDTFLSK